MPRRPQTIRPQTGFEKGFSARQGAGGYQPPFSRRSRGRRLAWPAQEVDGASRRPGSADPVRVKNEVPVFTEPVRRMSLRRRWQL